MTPSKEKAPRANVGPATDNEKPTPMAEGASADALSWDDTIGHDSTPAQDKLENTLRQCPPPGGGVHAWILSCANIARIAGVSEAGAEGRIAAAMTRPPKSNELRGAIRKAYDSPNAPAAPPAPKVAVSLFDDVTDTRGRPEPLRAILDGIRAGKWRAPVEAVRAAPGPAKDAAKKALPGFTPAGVFTARNKSGLAVHSGCVVVDLDNLPGPEEAAKVRDTLAHDPATVAAFISPSGCGVKALVAVETCADAAEHEAAYAEIAKDYAKRHGLNLDTSGKDVSRLCFVSHDPGAFIRPGPAAPFAWKPRPKSADFPQIVSAAEFVAVNRPAPPQVIHGVLRAMQTGMLSASSKVGKSWALLTASLAVPIGGQWFGWKTTPGRVLYINGELPEYDLEQRLRTLAEAMGLPGVPDGLDVWHLRGHPMSLAGLIPGVLTRQRQIGAPYALVIPDPLYKFNQGRDEIDNTAQAATVEDLGHLAERSGAAVLVCHHFSKGNQAAKDHLDRASGAGTLGGRGPDTALTLTAHNEPDCYSLEVTCRSFPKPAKKVVRWEYPLWRLDDTLDPERLKQPTPGRAPKYTPEQIVEAMPEGEVSHGDWFKAAAAAVGIGKTRFNDMVRIAKGRQLVFSGFGKYSRTAIAAPEPDATDGP